MVTFSSEGGEQKHMQILAGRNPKLHQLHGVILQHHELAQARKLRGDWSHAAMIVSSVPSDCSRRHYRPVGAERW